MNATKCTASSKYAKVSQDHRVKLIRPATTEESEGDASAVMVELVDGATWEGADRLLAYSVMDARKCLAEVAWSEPAAIASEDEILARIAQKHLGLGTLSSRRSDSLDFKEQSVWSIEAALRAAYEAGKAAK